MLFNSSRKRIPAYGILDDKYVLEYCVGKGATAKVYLGYNLHEENGGLFAFKLLNNLKYLQYHKREVESLKKFNHPNVMRYSEDGIAEVKRPKSKLLKLVHYIKMEYCSHGQLFSYVYCIKMGFQENHAKIIMHSLIEGLLHVHEKGIVHCDLKTDNILVDKDFNVQLADFGFSSERNGNGDGLLNLTLGTPGYTSPEFLAKKPYYGVSNDVFSLGVILFNLVTGNSPFIIASIQDTHYKMLANCNYEQYWESKGNQYLSPEFKSLFSLMVAEDYIQRPSLYEILHSPWMKSVSSDDLTKLQKEIKEEFEVRYEEIQEIMKKKSKNKKKNSKKKYFKICVHKKR